MVNVDPYMAYIRILWVIDAFNTGPISWPHDEFKPRVGQGPHLQFPRAERPACRCWAVAVHRSGCFSCPWATAPPWRWWGCEGTSIRGSFQLVTGSTPIAGWFLFGEKHGESLFNRMICGYPYFRKPHVVLTTGNDENLPGKMTIPPLDMMNLLAEKVISPANIKTRR